MHDSTFCLPSLVPVCPRIAAYAEPGGEDRGHVQRSNCNAAAAHIVIRTGGHRGRDQGFPCTGHKP